MAQEVAPRAHKPSTQPVVTRFLERRLWSNAPASTMHDAVAFQTRAYERSITIVRVFYGLSVLWAVQSITPWPAYARLQVAHPLWPAHWWFGWFSVRTSVNTTFWALMITSVVVALVPEQRVARFAYSFALLQYMAFVNGFDKINANFHGWFFVSVFLIFLPKGPWPGQRRASIRQYFLTVIWATQVTVLLFYSLTGIWKIHDGFFAFIHGKTGVFSMNAFSYIVANSLFRTNIDTVLGHYFARSVFIGWVLFMGTMYLESGSLIIAFRPRLQRVWGIGLILFHLGTQIVMGFTFPQNIALVALLIVASPFAPDHIRFKDAFLDLPWVHLVSRRIAALRRRNAQERSPAPAAAAEPGG
jgi:hypothetical protein